MGIAGVLAALGKGSYSQKASLPPSIDAYAYNYRSGAAGVQFQPSGAVLTISNNTTSFLTNWKTGDGGEYFIRAIPVQGTYSGPIGWNSLNNNVSWSVARASPGETEATFTVEIADKAMRLLDSTTVNLSVEIQSTGGGIIQ